MKKLAVLIAVIAFGGCARGWTAGQLYRDCQDDLRYSRGEISHPTLNASLCIGYVAGWAAGTNGRYAKFGNGMARLTFQEGVTPDQTSRVFVAYVDKHPERMNQQADDVLFDAMVEAKLLTAEP